MKFFTKILLSTFKLILVHFKLLRNIHKQIKFETKVSLEFLYTKKIYKLYHTVRSEKATETHFQRNNNLSVG